MKKLFTPILMVGALFASSAQAAQWQVDPSESSLGFRYEQMGSSQEGTFKQWSSSIYFDPDKLEKTDIKVLVDLTSVSAGGADQDGMLSEEEWFHTSKYPQAVYEVSNVKKLSAGKYQADGTLTIKDISVPVPLEFDLVIDGTKAIATINAELTRTAFNLGQKSFADESAVGNKVFIQSVLHASQ